MSEGMHHILALDPGAKGGLAVRRLLSSARAEVEAYPLPGTPTDIFHLLDGHARCLAQTAPVVIVVENVGHYMPGNGNVSSVTFARHCGFLDGLFTAMRLPVRRVAPLTWMKSLGALPKEKDQRKKAILIKMQDLYPHLDIKLSTSDALGLLTWAIRVDAAGALL